MQINDFLSLNPWWDNKDIQKKYQVKTKREQVSLVLNKLKHKNKITALIGPRQVGKTTVLMHTIEKLIQSNTPPQNIFYISFDRSNWQKITEQDLINLIQELTETRLAEIKKTFYLYLDEIHKLQNWENKLKYLLEAYQNLKIIISGSSSLNIEIGAGEGLVGRIEIIRLFPLTFREYLNWQDPGLIKAIKFKQDQIQINFREYLKKGGYPAVFFQKDQSEIYDLLLGYKSLSIMRDIVRLLKIGDPALLEDLLEILSSLTAERINYSNLGRLVGEVNVHTIKKYLNLLESAFFIKRAQVWTKKGLKPYRRERKIFFLDNGLRNALAQENFQDSLIWSKLAENAAVANYYADYNSQHPFQKKLFYWLDNGGEVDLITHQGEPVEIKYKDKLEIDDFKSIRKFLEIAKTKQGIILTKNLQASKTFPEGRVKIIPLWKWLLQTI